MYVKFSDGTTMALDGEIIYAWDCDQDSIKAIPLLKQYFHSRFFL